MSRSLTMPVDRQERGDEGRWQGLRESGNNTPPANPDKGFLQDFGLSNLFGWDTQICEPRSHSRTRVSNAAEKARKVPMGRKPLVRGGTHVASPAARAERPSQAPVDRLNVAGGPNVGREANRIAGGLGDGDEPDLQRFGGIEHRAGQGRAGGVTDENGGFRFEYEYQGEGDADVVVGIAGPVDGSLTEEADDAEDRDGPGARRRPSAKDLNEIWGMCTPGKDGAQYGDPATSTSLPMSKDKVRDTVIGQRPTDTRHKPSRQQQKHTIGHGANSTDRRGPRAISTPREDSMDRRIPQEDSMDRRGPRVISTPRDYPADHESPQQQITPLSIDSKTHSGSGSTGKLASILKHPLQNTPPPGNVSVSLLPSTKGHVTGGGDSSPLGCDSLAGDYGDERGGFGKGWEVKGGGRREVTRSGGRRGEDRRGGGRGEGGGGGEEGERRGESRWKDGQEGWSEHDLIRDDTSGGSPDAVYGRRSHEKGKQQRGRDEAHQRDATADATPRIPTLDLDKVWGARRTHGPAAGGGFLKPDGRVRRRSEREGGADDDAPARARYAHSQWQSTPIVATLRSEEGAREGGASRGGTPRHLYPGTDRRTPREDATDRRTPADRPVSRHTPREDTEYRRTLQRVDEILKVCAERSLDRGYSDDEWHTPRGSSLDRRAQREDSPDRRTPRGSSLDRRAQREDSPDRRTPRGSSLDQLGLLLNSLDQRIPRETSPNGRRHPGKEEETGYEYDGASPQQRGSVKVEGFEFDHGTGEAKSWPRGGGVVWEEVSMSQMLPSKAGGPSPASSNVGGGATRSTPHHRHGLHSVKWTPPRPNYRQAPLAEESPMSSSERIYGVNIDVSRSGIEKREVYRDKWDPQDRHRNFELGLGLASANGRFQLGPGTRRIVLELAPEERDVDASQLVPDVGRVRLEHAADVARWSHGSRPYAAGVKALLSPDPYSATARYADGGNGRSAKAGGGQENSGHSGEVRRRVQGMYEVAQHGAHGVHQGAQEEVFRHVGPAQSEARGPMAHGYDCGGGIEEEWEGDDDYDNGGGGNGVVDGVEATPREVCFYLVPAGSGNSRIFPTPVGVTMLVASLPPPRCACLVPDYIEREFRSSGSPGSCWVQKHPGGGETLLPDEHTFADDSRGDGMDALLRTRVKWPVPLAGQERQAVLKAVQRYVQEHGGLPNRPSDVLLARVSPMKVN